MSLKFAFTGTRSCNFGDLSTHESFADLFQKSPRVLHSPLCFFKADGVTLVISHKSQVFGSVECPSELHRKEAGLDQVQGKGSYQPAVRFGNLGRHWRLGRNKGCPGCIEHGLVSAVACAVAVVVLQKCVGACECAVGFGHQLPCVHRVIPSRAILFSR